MQYSNDFPIFNGIYLDTLSKGLQPDVSIVEQCNFLREGLIIRSSIHKTSRKTSEHYDNCKNNIADFLGVSVDNLAIMSNVDITWNILILSLVNTYGKIKCFVNILDHNSILAPVILQSQKGSIEIIWMDEDNMMEKMNDFLDERSVICLGDLSPILGVVRNINEIISLKNEKNAKLALDISRSIIQNKQSIDSIDFVVIDGSIDLLGPCGISLLYMRKLIDPVITGSGVIQNLTKFQVTKLSSIDKFEPGVPDLGALIALSTNINYFKLKGMDNIIKNRIELHKNLGELLHNLTNKYPVIVVNKDRDYNNSMIYSIYFDGDINSHDIALLLDETEKIAVRSGLGCAYLGLEYLGISDILQVSTHLYNTFDDINKFVISLENIMKILI